MDDDFVYAVANYLPNNDGRLIRLQRAGTCAAACAALETPQPEGAVNRVLLADRRLFFVFGRSGNVADDLRGAAPDGFTGGGTTLYTGPFLGDIAVGGGFLHVAEHGSSGIGAERLMVRPVDACPASTPQCAVALVADAVVTGMAADDDAVYFADAKTRTLGRKTRSGSSLIEPLVRDLTVAGGVALDGDDVYFSEHDPAADGGALTTGRVRRIGKNGKCASYLPCPQTVAAGIPALTSFAVGTTMVFFTSGTSGQVLRTPK